MSASFRPSVGILGPSWIGVPLFSGGTESCCRLVLVEVEAVVDRRSSYWRVVGAGCAFGCCRMLLLLGGTWLDAREVDGERWDECASPLPLVSTALLCQRLITEWSSLNISSFCFASLADFAFSLSSSRRRPVFSSYN